MIAERANLSPEIIHEHALGEAIALAKKFPDAKGFLIIDLDDVRDDTKAGFVRVANWILGRKHPEMRSQLPSVDDVMQGGLRRTYERLIPFAYYKQIWEAVEQRGNFFRRLPLVDPDLPAHLEVLQAEGFIPIMWLTARDVSQTDISREAGVARGLRDLPVYAEAPADNNAVAMKIQVLEQLVAILDKPMIMIDDNAHLITALDAHPDDRMIGVLYPTPPFADVPARRIATWPEVLGILQEG